MVVFALLSLNALTAPILTVETDNPTNNMFAVGMSAATPFVLNGMGFPADWQTLALWK